MPRGPGACYPHRSSIAAAIWLMLCFSPLPAAATTSTSSLWTASGGMTRASPSCPTRWATSTTGCLFASQKGKPQRTGAGWTTRAGLVACCGQWCRPALRSAASAAVLAAPSLFTLKRAALPPACRHPMGGGLHQSLQQHSTAQHVQQQPAAQQLVLHQQLGHGGTTPSSRAQSGGGLG